MEHWIFRFTSSKNRFLSSWNKWSTFTRSYLLKKMKNNCFACPYGGFLKWWYPTTMGFPTKNDHFGGGDWGYHHFRKHPYLYPENPTFGTWESMGKKPSKTKTLRKISAPMVWSFHDFSKDFPSFRSFPHRGPMWKTPWENFHHLKLFQVRWVFEPLYLGGMGMQHGKGGSLRKK